MSCKTCNHSDHQPGHCTNCNCGESEICRSQPGYGFWSPRSEYEAEIKPSGGIRIGYDKNVDED